MSENSVRVFKTPLKTPNPACPQPACRGVRVEDPPCRGVGPERHSGARSKGGVLLLLLEEEEESSSSFSEEEEESSSSFSSSSPNIAPQQGKNSDREHS
jgi:hypothetical protein